MNIPAINRPGINVPGGGLQPMMSQPMYPQTALPAGAIPLPMMSQPPYPPYPQNLPAGQMPPAMIPQPMYPQNFPVAALPPPIIPQAIYGPNPPIWQQNPMQYGQPIYPTEERAINYPDGTRYIGRTAYLSNGISTPHGRGTLWSANGDIYSGEFNYGQRSGYGEETYVNGDTYKGQFSCDKFHGQGESFRMRDQRRHIGGYIMSAEEGEAIIMDVGPTGQRRYHGLMRGGLRHGPGVMFYRDQMGQVCSLKGEWNMDRIEGPGGFAQGDVCWSGTFVRGVLQGKGKELVRSTGSYRDVWFTNGNVYYV
jgi:hypothetical protein